MLKRTSPPVVLSDVHARLSAGSTAPAVYDPPLDAEEGAAVVVVAAAAGESSRSQAAFGEDGAGAEAAAAASQHTNAFAVTVPPPAVAAASPSAPALGGAGVSSSCDVHPAAVPARRFRNIYDGIFYRPPGTTKRALGRMRLIWCCVVTNESWHASLVGVPILIFTTLFAAGVVPTGEWFSYVFTAVFTALSLTCLTLSVTLDPGIVPPAPVSEQPTGPATVMVDGQPVECRVCTTCHIIRPPRSTHCRSCDVCVEEFDHHCGILGSCVGKRNFRFFGGFFIVTSLLATYVFIRSMVVVTTTDFKSTGPAASQAWLAAACVLCIFAAIIGGILVVPCAARYIMLSATNVTFKETLRTQQQAVMSGEQPAGCVPVPEMQSENYLRNFVRRLLSPIGRSRIPFDYYV